MAKKIVIKADDFKYPSENERKIAKKDYPEIKPFSFKYEFSLESILSKKTSFKDASEQENLYWWDICLQNRLHKLYETYVYTITNYNRGFTDDYLKCSHKEVVNHIMFDYYAEIFYYYFISTIEIIAQIIRIYYQINNDITEKNLNFNKTFINKINDSSVENALTTFYNATEQTREIRNCFTHRFPMNQPDFRSSINDNIEGTSLIPGTGKSISSKEILENIYISLNSLSVLLKELKKEIRQ